MLNNKMQKNKLPSLLNKGLKKAKAKGVLLMLLSVALAQGALAETTWQYSFGLHQSWVFADDYFEFDGKQIDHLQNRKAGLELGAYSKLPWANEVFELGLEWVDFGKTGGMTINCSNNLNCSQRTEIEQQAVMANVYYDFKEAYTLQFKPFAGLSYVFAKGKLNGNAWDNNATGLQLGVLMEHETGAYFDPFVSVRWHQFVTDIVGDEARINDASVTLGVKF